MSEGLWNAIERFLDDAKGLPQAPTDTPAEQHMPLSTSGQAQDTLVPAAPSVPRPPVQRALVPELRPVPVDAETRDEVQALKLRYIVGRIAGRDLLDGSGQRIVSQGQIITEDAVFRAEQAGKLVELIVHMSSTEVYDGQ